MRIRLGYDIRFDIAAPVPMIALLTVHPSRRHLLQEPDRVQIEPAVELEEYSDLFGNIGVRFVAPPGSIRLHNSTLDRGLRRSRPGVPECEGSSDRGLAA